MNRNKAYHNVFVGYHKAVKKIAGLCTWDSNHLECESVGVNICRHLQSKNYSFLLNDSIASENKSMINFKYHFRYKSFIR